MNPFIRSFTELMVTTQSRDQENTQHRNDLFNSIAEDSGQRKRYVKSQNEKGINLPALPNVVRPKWKKSKEAVSKFLNSLDYNNQIQSSYDLTLLERQKNYDNKDAA